MHVGPTQPDQSQICNDGQSSKSTLKDYSIVRLELCPASYGSQLLWFQVSLIVGSGQFKCGSIISVDLKNQARVHLWYEQRFGRPCPRLQTATDGIDRYLISCTCIGIDAATGELYAPNGLQETWDGHLRINPVNPQPDRFISKAQDYQARWPWLTIQP
jgi:hypothetical protein